MSSIAEPTRRDEAMHVVAQIIAKRSLSIRDIAGKVGVQPRTINLWITTSGKIIRFPTLLHLAALRQLLVSPKIRVEFDGRIIEVEVPLETFKISVRSIAEYVADVLGEKWATARTPLQPADNYFIRKEKAKLAWIYGSDRAVKGGHLMWLEMSIRDTLLAAKRRKMGATA